MKKLVLFFTVMLIGLTPVTASTTGYVVLNGEDLNANRFRFADPISFIERGVEFLIFPDGSFDFNTDFSNFGSDLYYRNNTRRASINRTYGAPGIRTRPLHPSWNAPAGVLITHDANGQVRRIGNVFINYDRFGRIKRAGSLYMRYHRALGLLQQVGGLRIQYNRWGQIVHTSGFVNHLNMTPNFGPINGVYQDDYYGYHSIDDYDEDFYYYRRDGEIKKQRRLKG